MLNPLLSSVVSAAESCCVDGGARLDKYDASTEVAGGVVSDWRPSLSSSKLKLSLGKTPGLCRFLGDLRLTSWGKRDQILEPLLYIA